MPDERLIQEIENILSEVISLGGQRERTSIVPNMLVRDAAPAGQDDYIIIADNRDNDNILALKVPGVVYADNDLVNVIFPEGGEAIAFQQGSGSTTSGLWDVVPGTDDIFYDKGDVGIGKSVAPDAALEILDTSQQQLRLTFQEDTKYADFTVDTNHDLTIDPSSDGIVKIDSETLTLDDNEVPVIVDSITKTVQAAGGDFTTIQAAVNWFKEKLIVGSCIIDVEAGTYAESVNVVDLFIGAAGSLEIEGDTRVLAGQSYVDGAETNTQSKANGGTGVFTLANAGNDITVTGATTNPDFDADGWGNGDKILAYDNAGATAEHTIDSVLNNVITLTAAAPALGNDGTAIVLQPDRKISAATALTVDGPRGLQISGFYLVGTAGDGLSATNGAVCIARNCLANPSRYGFVATESYSAIDCSGGAISAWDGSQGYRANVSASIVADASVAVGPVTGYRAQNFSYIKAQNAVGVNCTTAFDVQIFSNLETFQAYARQNTTGYKAVSFSFIRALVTNAKNNGNATDYNPAVSGTHGNNGAMIQWT